jgi:2-dehydro-3-deoxyphosphogluconate aldolase/(4S)-4-hydroxy-2-oxoglutarate aldolase
MIPGVMTPSEAVAAWQMDVPLLKLFPVGAVGVEYFKAMLAPLNHMRFMCNGAVNAENTREFLKAGAVAIGMGGWLTGDGHTPLAHIRSRALQLQQAVAEARGAAVTHNV